MNDYCLNQSQGLKGQQHTSSYNEYPANYPLTSPPPHPPAYSFAPGCIPHKPKKNET